MNIKKRLVFILLIGSTFLGTGFAMAAPGWPQPELRIAAVDSTDLMPPTGSVEINDGDASTNDPAVILTLNAVDNTATVDFMSFSDDGAAWSGWVAYDITADWTLPGGDGNKTVWARFKDTNENTSTAVFDSIFFDTVAPTGSATTPKISTNVSKTKIFSISWIGVDTDPSSGLASYDIEVKTNLGGAWTAFKTGVAAGSGLFTGAPGKTYYFRARAHDGAGNIGPWSAESKTIVPQDQSKGIVKRVGFAGTISKAGSRYYLGTVRYSSTRGDEITYSFTGNYFALVGTKGPKFSKAVVVIDGVRKTIDAKAGSKKFRQVLMEKRLSMKKHTAKIKNLGTPRRSRFEIDGNAVGK